MSTLVVPRALPAIGLALALSAPLACTKSEPDTSEAAAEPESSPEPATADAPKPKAELAAATDSLGKTVAEGIATATGNRLDRGIALGHVVMPNPSKFLAEIRTKVVPSAQAGFLDEAALRGLVGMQLGARSGLAQHIVLDQPMGCVVIEDTTTKVPVACAVGYTGGAAAAATDLGTEGKQADAAGHVAAYRVDGNDLYLDDLGGHVVISTGPEIFGKAKDYLASTIIGRAASVTDDIELVAFPQAAMARYSTEIEAVMAEASKVPTMEATGNPMIDAVARYSKTSMDRSLDYYRDTEQFELGMGLEDVGFVFRYAAFPATGSGMQEEIQSISSGPIDASLVSSLPAEAWAVTAYTLDWNAVWDMESAVAMRDVMLDLYATATGTAAAEARAAIEAFLAENASLYGKDVAMAVMHLPGTQGGMVLSRTLSAPGRDSWKTWSEGFGPEAVMGAEAIKTVTWSFTPGALEIDGVPVDRWTIEPGPEAKAEIAKMADPAIAELERRFGGLKLNIDRVELDDRALFVIAPGSEEAYLRAAIAAAKGGPGVGTDAGFTALLARNPGTSAVMALDVGGAFAWAREVMPPEATRKIPPGIGQDLGDFYFAASYGASGSQRGEMVLSQSMIDQLRGLAG